MKCLDIVITEDCPPTRRSLDLTLRRLGHRTHLHESGDAFLHAIDRMSPKERARIDLLVTDINMPGTMGGELIHALDARGFCLPVVVITAYDKTALEETFAKRGAVCFLCKPFRPEALIGAIEETYSIFTASCRDGDAMKNPERGGESL